MHLISISAIILFHFTCVLHAVEVLDCSFNDVVRESVNLNCDFREISEDLCYGSLFNGFQRMTNRKVVKHLRTGNCQSEKLDLELFGTFSGLYDFDFSFLGVESLPTLKMESLQSLNASHNKIRNVSASSFSRMANIMDIDLSFNRISMLESDTFSHLTQLRMVNLSDNSINVIEGGLFQENTKLNVLQLENNPIKRMDETLLSLLMRSVSVKVSCDGVEELDTSCLENSLEVDLSQQNQVVLRMEINHLELQCAKKTFQSLKYLNISRNELENAKELIDLLGSSIEILDFSSNFIDKLNDSSLKRWTNLRILKLDRNELSHLDFGIFQHQKKLKSLDLSYNLLEKVEFYPNSPCERFKLTDLQTLNVKGNQLTEIDYITPTNFPKLVDLIVLENPWPVNYLPEYIMQWKNPNQLNKSSAKSTECPNKIHTTTESIPSTVTTTESRTSETVAVTISQSTKSETTSEHTKKDSFTEIKSIESTKTTSSTSSSEMETTHSEISIESTTVSKQKHKQSQNQHHKPSNKTRRHFDLFRSSAIAPNYRHKHSNGWNYVMPILLLICCAGFIIKLKCKMQIGKVFRRTPRNVPYRLDQQESYIGSVNLIHHLDFKELSRNSP